MSMWTNLPIKDIASILIGGNKYVKWLYVYAPIPCVVV